MSTPRRLMLPVLLAALAAAALAAAAGAGERPLNQPPEGFTALFNGKNLDGWWGLGTVHYGKYRDLPPGELEKMKEKSRADIRKHWRIENGVAYFPNL